MSYDTFGGVHSAESGIQEFLKALPEVLLEDDKNYAFITPAKAAKTLQVVSALNVPSATSWVDEERDLTAWLGNEMQNEAVDKLYALAPRMAQCTDEALLKDWQYLQSSEHFYYMGTKYFANGSSRAYQSPYPTPYEAFINYMNVLSDFAERLNAVAPANTDTQVEALKAQNDKLQNQLNELEQQLIKVNIKEKPARKTATRKSADSAEAQATEEKKPAKRTTRKKADDAAADATEVKPKTSRAKKA